jgi:hypothetical protein
MIELFGPRGEAKGVAQNASVATIVTAIEAAGSYTVIVSDASQSGAGTYRLNLTRGSIAPAGVNILTNGATHLGSITASVETNTWTFTASAGETIVVRVGEIIQTGAFSPRLRLLNPTGAQQAVASGAIAADIAVTATNSGTFTLVVDSGGTGTGTYRLSLARTGSPVVISANDEGGALTNGATHIASIDLGDLDAWVFTANPGESMAVRIGEVTASLTPQLRLYGPNGALLDSGSGVVATEVTARATNAGTFLVVAGDLTSGYAGTGNYRLTLTKAGGPLTTSAGDEGGALTNGATEVAGIDPGDIDAWAFIANAGENIVVRMGEATASLSPQLRLFGPNGALLDSAFGVVAAEVAFRATNSGRFIVLAADQTSGFAGSGNYRLTLARTGSPLAISANDEGGPLTNGTIHTASIEVGDIDTWSLTASAGESMVIRMGEVTAGLAPQLRLYGPDGVLLDSSSGVVATEVTARATNSGTFLLVAGDLTSGYGGTGDYRLTLAKTGGPLLTSAGDEGGGMTGVESYGGMIETGDVDVWTFSARAGDLLSINATELVNGSPLTPQLRLYGRDGTLLRSSSGVATTQFSNFVAPTNGTYLVVISDLSSGYTGTGTYRMTVNQLSDGLKLYAPIIAGGNVKLLAVGGSAEAAFTLLTTTNVITPLTLWSPLPYQFDQFGVADFVATFGSSEPQRYFLLRAP